jgi:hypothetical protein
VTTIRPVGEGGAQPVRIEALRVLTGMEVDEFAAAVGDELGWSLPLFVYIQWEKDQATAPAGVLDAAFAVSTRHPIGPRESPISRRSFLGGAFGLSVLAGSQLAARRPRGALAAGGWRAGETTAGDLEQLVESYRRAYAGRAAVAELLPGATGLMHVLLDLGRYDRWPTDSARLASLVGQMAVLVGLLQLMGPRDLAAARAHYELALRAARDAEDWDLAAYVLGSLAFHASSVGRPADARAISDGAWALAQRRAAPRTRAWVAALGSELRARGRDAAGSRRLLAAAHAAMDRTRGQPEWKGVGFFDEPRLAAYEGTNLLLAGRYAAAEEQLRAALGRLDPLRLKHRSTLSADLAMTFVHRAEIDAACAHAAQALTLADAIAHRESIERVRRVHFQLQRWRSHPAVRDLTDRLALV